MDELEFINKLMIKIPQGISDRLGQNAFKAIALAAFNKIQKQVPELKATISFNEVPGLAKIHFDPDVN